MMPPPGGPLLPPPGAELNENGKRTFEGDEQAAKQART